MLQQMNNQRVLNWPHSTANRQSNSDSQIPPISFNRGVPNHALMQELNNTDTRYLDILCIAVKPSVVQTLNAFEFDPIANKSPEGWNAMALMACTSSRVATV